MPNLNQIEAMVIDMDGVLVRGATLLPGVADLFEWLHTRSLPYMIATNNAATSPEILQRRLKKANVEVAKEAILTSGQAAAGYLLNQVPQDSRLFVIGEEPLRNALNQVGFTLTEDAERSQAVIVGLDRKVDWQMLTDAARAIQSGSLFIGTNPDTSFPTESGKAIGAGALLALLEAATGIPPVVIGKPEPHLYLQAIEFLGVSADRTLAVGDRLETDILGGERAGMATALVLTGITSPSDLANSTIRPDWVFDNLTELRQALQEAFA